MRKIAISLSKGGVGKTTTAVHLAHGLARRGNRVLLIDTDTQGQGASFLGANPKRSLSAVIEDDVAPTEATEEVRENLWLLAGGRAMANTRKFIDMKDFGGERTFIEALAPLEDKYDYVIIDTGPGWDSLTANALFYATEVLIPASLEAATLQGILEFQNSIERVKQYHDDLDFRYVVPTYLDSRVKKDEEIHGILEEHFGDKLCPPIRYNVRLSEAAGLGKTIFEYDESARGAQDYEKLTNHIANNGQT